MRQEYCKSGPKAPITKQILSGFLIIGASSFSSYYITSPYVGVQAWCSGVFGFAFYTYISKAGSWDGAGVGNRWEGREWIQTPQPYINST